MIGESFQHYRITGRIGAGGMGEVFRARDTRLNRDVAVKVLPENFLADAQRLRRFERESKTLAALNHANVLTIHDAGVHEGTPYLVSELLEGKTLRQEINGRALPLRKATDYALQISRGLAAAHDKGIIHRDLKPENIFITKDGQVKILDFGLAKLRDPSPAHRAASPLGVENGETDTIRIDANATINTTEPGIVLGTPAYMSPEQVRGEPADHRADIFAFGCVLYEMLSGVRAFRRDTPVESMNAVLKDTPPEVSATNPSTPIALARIVERCLEKQPEDRFQSARDLAFALTEISPRSREREAAQPVGHAAIFRRAIVPTVTVVGILILGAGGWWFRRQHSVSPSSSAAARHITSLAVKPLDDFSGDTNQAYLSDGMTEALCAALGNISALRVPGRSSVMRYKGGGKSIQEMARELNVDAIVEGSIQRMTNRLLITLQLIQAATDRHLWSTNCERDLSDFFTVQREVARAITTEVSVRLRPHEERRLADATPVNAEAVEYYLKGRHSVARWTPSGIRDGVGYLEKAIHIESRFASANAALANAYIVAAYIVFQPSQAIPKAEAAAREAVRLDDSLVDAHCALATAKLHQWDWAGAEEAFQRALSLNEHYALAHEWYAWYFIAQGRTNEAVAQMQRALELEPVSIEINPDMAWIFLFARRYDEARRQSQETLRLDPANYQAHESLGWSYVLSGDYEAGIRAFSAAQRLEDSPTIRCELASAHARAGHREEALQRLRALEQERGANDRYVAPDLIAAPYASLGMRDEAFTWFGHAFEEKCPRMTWVRLGWDYDPLRSDPRFAELGRKIGLDK